LNFYYKYVIYVTLTRIGRGCFNFLKNRHTKKTHYCWKLYTHCLYMKNVVRIKKSTEIVNLILLIIHAILFVNFVWTTIKNGIGFYASVEHMFGFFFCENFAIKKNFNRNFSFFFGYIGE
jgi:hypothetical protein